MLLLMMLEGMAVVLVVDLFLAVVIIVSRYSVAFLVLLIADLIMVLLGIWL